MAPLPTNFRTLRRLALATVVAGLAACAAAPAANAGINSWTPLLGLSPVPDHVRGYETGTPDATTIYAWTEGDGVYRSTNNGGTWSSLNGGLEGIPGAKDVRVVYTGFSDVLAGTGAGLFKLSGGSWVPVAQGAEDDPKNPKKLNTSVQALHSSGGVLLAGGFSSGVYRSTDNGETWIPPQPGNGMPSSTTVWQLTSWIPGHIYAATSSGLFVTFDNGASWTPIGDGLPGTVLRVFKDASNPNIWYASTLGGGIYRSITLGATWHPLNGDPGPHQLGNGTVRDWYQVNGVDSNGKAFANIYAATGDGLWAGRVSSDLPVGALGGPIKWRHVTETGLGGHDIFWALKTFPNTPGILLAGTDGGGGYHLELKFPVNTAAPTISGTTANGSTLTATTGTWTGTPDIEYSYQWQRCTSSSANSCTVDIPGATSSTYALSDADEGKWVRVVVTAENAFPTFDLAEKPSNVTAQIGVNPANLPGNAAGRAAASITGPADGFPQPGDVLTANNPTWFPGTEPGKVDSWTYQWFTCTNNSNVNSCTSIPGATAKTYTIKESEVGKWHRVLAIGHNQVGSAPAENLSGTINNVFPPDPKQIAAPAIMGNPVVGETLYGNVGAWEWQGTQFKRSWEICNAQGQSCGSISNPNATYKPTNDDIGDTVRIRLTVDSNGPNVKPDPVEVIVGPTAPIQPAPVAENGGGGGNGGGGAGGGGGGGGGDIGGGGGPLGDTVLPTLKSLGLAKKKVKVGGTLQLRYDLSEPGSLQIRIDQLVSGRKKGKKCSTKIKKGKKCVIMKKKGTITLTNLSGKGTATFKAAIGKKKLARGNYEAIVVPIDAAGNKGKARMVKFTVTKK